MPQFSGHPCVIICKLWTSIVMYAWLLTVACIFARQNAMWKQAPHHASANMDKQPSFSLAPVVKLYTDHPTADASCQCSASDATVYYAYIP